MNFWIREGRKSDLVRNWVAFGNRDRLGRVTFFAVGLLLSSTGALWGQPESEDQLLKLMDISYVSEFRWSPDGKHIAYISNLSGTNQIHLLSLDHRKSVQLTHHDSPAIDPQWSPDGKKLLFLSDPGWQERYEVWQVDLQRRDSTRLLSNTGAIQKHVRWSPVRSRAVLETNGAGNFDLALWSPEDPVLRPLARSTGDELEPEWSPDGRWVAFVSKGSVWRLPVEGGEPEQLVEPGLGAAVRSPRWAPDGRHLLFLTDLMGYWDIGVYSFSSGEWKLAVTDSYEESAAVWSPDSQQIAFISTQGFDRLLGVLDLESGRVEYLVGKGGVCSSPSWSPDGTKLTFLFSTPQRTQDLWFYAKGALRQLTDSMPGWSESEFVRPEIHAFKSREGFSIPALLYKPNSFKSGERHPAIVRIHGGFTGQWVNSFDLLGQYFLRQGIILFYPNPRGGGGYGRAYERLNDGDWGGGDYDDLLRGDDYLKALSFVDPDRVAAWGGSYGGYLTFTLVARAPERFRAAVVRAGISDLRSQILERRGSPSRLNNPLSGYPKEMGGLPDENPDFYRERSPLTWSKQVRTPMLIMHGLRDDRVPPNQSQVWVQALRENGVPVEFKEYPREDHSLARSKSTLTDRLERMAAFLRRYGF